MVSEYKTTLQCFCDASGIICWPRDLSIPAHFKVIHKFKLGEGGVDEFAEFKIYGVF